MARRFKQKSTRIKNYASLYPSDKQEDKYAPWQSVRPKHIFTDNENQFFKNIIKNDEINWDQFIQTTKITWY